MSNKEAQQFLEKYEAMIVKNYLFYNKLYVTILKAKQRLKELQ